MSTRCSCVSDDVVLTRVGKIVAGTFVVDANIHEDVRTFCAKFVCCLGAWSPVVEVRRVHKTVHPFLPDHEIGG